MPPFTQLRLSPLFRHAAIPMVIAAGLLAINCIANARKGVDALPYSLSKTEFSTDSHTFRAKLIRDEHDQPLAAVVIWCDDTRPSLGRYDEEITMSWEDRTRSHISVNGRILTPDPLNPTIVLVSNDSGTFRTQEIRGTAFMHHVILTMSDATAEKAIRLFPPALLATPAPKH